MTKEREEKRYGGKTAIKRRGTKKKKTRQRKHQSEGESWHFSGGLTSVLFEPENLTCKHKRREEKKQFYLQNVNIQYGPFLVHLNDHLVILFKIFGKLSV